MSFLIALAWIAQAAWAMPTPPEHAGARAGAMRALDRCDRRHASYWAQQITDPEQAALYRLAWLEKTAAQLSAAPAAATSQLAWRPTSELWADEAPLSGTCSVHTAFSRLPMPVTRSLLGPWLMRYSQARAPLREALKRYALFEWLDGKRLTLESLDADCDWSALRVLHSGAKDLSALAQRCPVSPGSLLETLVQARVGDEHLKAGRAHEAFEAFQTAVGGLPDRVLPKTLAYRIAVSGLLGGGSDLISLRMAYVAGSTEETGGALSPLLRSSLSNLVCERLSMPDGVTTVRVLHEVFSGDRLISETLGWLKGCSDPTPVAAALLKDAKLPRDRATLLAVLLEHAVAHGQPAQARRWATALSEVSRSSPRVASQAFWGVLPRASQPLGTDLISTYRKRAQWLAVDQTRLDRWRRPKAIVPQAEALLANARDESASLKLPIAALNAPLEIKAEIPTGFGQLLRAELGEP